MNHTNYVFNWPSYKHRNPAKTLVYASIFYYSDFLIEFLIMEFCINA
jgi:hypothetical protein